MKSAIVTLFVLLATIQLHAQEMVRPEKGVMTLDFSIERNFDLEAASGASLSMRRWLSEKSALSIGLSISADDRDGSRQVGDTVIDSLIFFDSDDSNSGFEFRLETQLHRILRGSNPMLILGGGPFISISDFNRESDYGAGQGDSYKSEFSEKHFGLAGQISAEWFLKKYLSLSASYRPSLYWFDLQDDNNSYQDGQLDRTDHNENKGWKLETGNVRLGLSIWFE